MSFVIVGGGIAGVSCAEELSRLLPCAHIHLVSGSPLVKAVSNYTKISRTLESFDVEERPVSYITQLCPNVTVHQAKVLSIDSNSKTTNLSDGAVLDYDKLCLCTGASPSMLVEGHPLVLGIRDVESVQKFQERLGQSRRIMVVGNGGIATEIVYEVELCDVIWAIKDRAICHTFVDEGAATFFLPHLILERKEEEERMEGDVVKISSFKKTKYSQDGTVPGAQDGSSGSGEAVMASGEENVMVGVALGPDWHANLKMTGKHTNQENYRHVHVEYQAEVKQLLTYEEVKTKNLVPTQPTTMTKTKSSIPTETPCGEAEGGEAEVRGGGRSPPSGPVDEMLWPLYVELTNGTVYGCDLVVSATGVSPNVNGVNMVGERLILQEGGVVVDQEMRTSISDMYAAGDICSVKWEGQSKVWFQMRLWTQARQMGSFAAHCMVAHTAGSSITLDFCFELFAHVTKFFGYKVVLLGLYNAQCLGQDYEILLRCTRGVEYVKVILKEGRMVGAILIGETDLEETFENLILNQMDLSSYGESLLDPRVDIEDYFD